MRQVRRGSPLQRPVVASTSVYTPFDSCPSVPPEARYLRMCSATQSHFESVARSRSSATAMAAVLSGPDGILVIRYGRQENRVASADPLGQGNDDPFWPAHVGHAPDVLILTGA